jgi:hypothetical protein
LNSLVPEEKNRVALKYRPKDEGQARCNDESIDDMTGQAKPSGGSSEDAVV